MSLYNLLTTPLECPHCGHRDSMVAEMKVGYANVLRYELGDRVEWSTEGMLPEGRRPSDGNLDGEGYVVCTLCNKDFWIVVEVRDDVLTTARVDHSKPGYSS